MTLTSAMVRELVSAGLSGDALVAACERIEREGPKLRNSPKLSSGVSRGSRLPVDWFPCGEAWRWALAQCGARSSPILDSFRDYWTAQPGQKGVKLDWDATWRNWVRREIERRPAVAQFSGRRNPMAAFIKATGAGHELEAAGERDFPDALRLPGLP